MLSTLKYFSYRLLVLSRINRVLISIISCSKIYLFILNVQRVLPRYPVIQGGSKLERRVEEAEESREDEWNTNCIYNSLLLYCILLLCIYPSTGT